MAYEERRPPVEIPHGIVMDNRKKLSVSGVTEVESFNEQEVIMGTSQGVLTVHGENLHMEKLSVDSGDVMITGSIDSLEYEDSAPSGEGFFARLFR